MPFPTPDTDIVDAPQAKLQSEISVLQQGAAEREAAKSRAAAELLSSNSNFSLTLASSDTMAVT